MEELYIENFDILYNYICEKEKDYIDSLKNSKYFDLELMVNNYASLGSKELFETIKSLINDMNSELSKDLNKENMRFGLVIFTLSLKKALENEKFRDSDTYGKIMILWNRFKFMNEYEKNINSVKNALVNLGKKR